MTAGDARQADAVTNTNHNNENSAHASGFRFSRAGRLLEAAAYSRVFKKAERSHDRLFTVLARSNGRQNARLGLAVSKKHCKLAVGRNRIKRVIRESFRRHQAELRGLDLVVLNKPGAAQAGNKALFDSLARHWQKCRSTTGQDKKQNG